MVTRGEVGRGWVKWVMGIKERTVTSTRGIGECQITVLYI